MAKREKFTTPKGTFIFPKLTEPDYKFKENGEYSLKLRLDGEDAKELKQQLESRRDEWVAEWKKDNKKKPKVADLSCTEVVDDEGNETGEMDFKFSMPARVKTQAGKEFDLSPKLFDSKGKPIPKGTQIWGNSVGRVAYWIRNYEAPIGVGIALKLEAVQVIELVGPETQSADSFGFGEEDGFEAPDEPQETPDEDPAPESEPASSDNGDDDPDF